MDPAGPPDGTLEQLFDRVDAMAADHGQDPPPWHPITESAPETVPKEGVGFDPTPETAPKETMELKRIGYKQQTLGDIRADKEEKAQQLLEQRLQESRQPDKQTLKQNDVIEQNMHVGHANKLLDDKIKYPNGGVSYKQDEVGLTKAYNDVSYPGVYYDEGTRTMYVKGTTNAQDWSDDALKIPIWGDLKESWRYGDAERAYRDILDKGKPIDRVVGHSLGGSVALQQQTDHDIPYSRTFGAPVLELNPLKRGTVDRVRHPLDPVSVFDRAAKWGPLMAYPHTFTGFIGLDAASAPPVDYKTLAMKARGM